ncbi:MAG TPA: hypothetical protein VFT98_20090 [Myxococcota bacterium]|nr:hypothetical protein [Myxococcota bacterium]
MKTLRHALERTGHLTSGNRKMTSLLVINGLLPLLAVKRGRRVAPFVLLALPRVLAELDGSLPAIADPEPA